MRQRLDCALVLTETTRQWAAGSAGVFAGGRLHIRSPLDVVDTDAPGASDVLASASMLLRSYDVCLVPVASDNLIWVRTCLSAARGQLHTPVIALVHNLQAAALHDLLLLGVTDFVRAPLSVDELRIRIERIVAGRTRAVIAAAPLAFQVSEPPLVRYEKVHSSSYHTADDTGGETIERLFLGSDLQFDALGMAAVSESLHYNESFRAVKGKIIERFERSYIQAALKRHSGNIAMAARTAQKHRRAFWAQMQKYDIDAAVYRPNKHNSTPLAPVCPGASKRHSSATAP